MKLESHSYILSQGLFTIGPEKNELKRRSWNKVEKNYSKVTKINWHKKNGKWNKDKIAIFH